MVGGCGSGKAALRRWLRADVPLRDRLMPVRISNYAATPAYGTNADANVADGDEGVLLGGGALR